MSLYASLRVNFRVRRSPRFSRGCRHRITCTPQNVWPLSMLTIESSKAKDFPVHYHIGVMETPDLKRKASPTGSPLATPLLDDGFTKVEKRKKKRLDKHRPQFQYDTSYFRTGKKIGIAVR